MRLHTEEHDLDIFEYFQKRLDETVGDWKHSRDIEGGKDKGRRQLAK
jgi:hypothetical protein